MVIKDESILIFSITVKSSNDEYFHILDNIHKNLKITRNNELDYYNLYNQIDMTKEKFVDEVFILKDEEKLIDKLTFMTSILILEDQSFDYICKNWSHYLLGLAVSEKDRDKFREERFI